MTKEESLLMPRRKVMIDYPFSCLRVGTIIDDPVPLTYPQSFTGGVSTFEFMDNYPEIFQPLPWYAERNVEELPEYVKCTQTPDQWIQPEQVLKVEWGQHWGVSGEHYVVIETGCFVPSNETEYTTYINSLKK